MIGWNPAPNRLISIINDMPQEEFKGMTEKLLGQMRFRITKADSAGKYLEFEAVREDDDQGRMFLIRAARGTRMISPEELQATVGRKKGSMELTPVFISTGGFTEEASKYADMLNISLADGDKLGLLLRNYDMADEIVKSADRRLIEKDGDRFLPSIDELEKNMKWGNDFFASGNHRKAIEYYDSALRLKSQYDLAWLMKGNALAALGDHEEAMECFKKVLEFNPESEEAWYNLGAIMYRMGRFEDEMACYDKALEINPDYIKAWNNKGATLHQLGKFEEAVMCYDRVLKLEPDNVSVLNNRGVALKNLKSYGDALASFEKALRKKPDYVDAWLNKGILLHDMERYADAVTCYDYVLSRWKSPEVLCQRGVAMAMLGKYRQAIEGFDASLALKPGWTVAMEEKRKAEEALAREGAAKALEAQGAMEPKAPEPPAPGPGCKSCGTGLTPEARFCPGCGTSLEPEIDPRLLPVGKSAQLEAIEEDEAEECASRTEEMLLEKSRLLRAMGKDLEALGAIKDAMCIGERPELWLELGNVLAALGRIQEAIEAYDRVLGPQPGNIFAMSNKEMLLSETGDLKAALELNARITGAEPGDVHAWLRRANMLRAMGRLKESVECMGMLTGAIPELAEVWNAQGVALLEMGKHDEAILCFDRAIQIDPDFSDAWNNKGAAMVAAGRLDKSLHYFDRALGTDQENSGAWANKAAALYEMGRFQETVECLEEALVLSRSKHLLNSMGWTLLADNKASRAMECFDDAISIDPDYAEAWNNRGLAYSRLEDPAQAFDSFSKALALAPDFEDARKNMDATAKSIEHLSGRKEAKAEVPAAKLKPAPELAEAVKQAEELESEELDSEEFKCPFCGSLGSIDDVFCEKCGQKFDRAMKEDAVEEKLEHILDPEPPKVGPAKKPKPGKKSKTDLKEELVTVPGVGYAKAGIIIDAGYDTEAKLRKATVGDIGNVPGIGEGLARKIKRKYK